MSDDKLDDLELDRDAIEQQLRILNSGDSAAILEIYRADESVNTAVLQRRLAEVEGEIAAVQVRRRAEQAEQDKLDKARDAVEFVKLKAEHRALIVQQTKVILEFVRLTQQSLDLCARANGLTNERLTPFLFGTQLGALDIAVHSSHIVGEIVELIGAGILDAKAPFLDGVNFAPAVHYRTTKIKESRDRALRESAANRKRQGIPN
jgi:hypothetical protein